MKSVFILYFEQMDDIPQHVVGVFTSQKEAEDGLNNLVRISFEESGEEEFDEDGESWLENDKSQYFIEEVLLNSLLYA